MRQVHSIGENTHRKRLKAVLERWTVQETMDAESAVRRKSRYPYQISLETAKELYNTTTIALALECQYGDG